MKVGDLVKYQNQTWRVYRMDSQVRTATLLSWSKETLEVEDDAPGLEVIADVTVWPFVAAPRKSDRSGSLVRLTRTVNLRTIDLKPNEDWAPSDPYRSGGSIFLNPTLDLKLGEVLVAHYESGTPSRIAITQGFGSVAQRRRRVSRPPNEPRTWMNHLIDDDD